MVTYTYRAKSVLKVPVIGEYRKKYYHSRLPGKTVGLSDKTLKANALGLVAFVVNCKFYNDKVRLLDAIP
jgi:hypothetical protein